MLKMRPSDSRVIANKLKTFGVYAIALLVFLISLMMNYRIAYQYKSDVDVVIFSQDVGGGVVVTSDMLRKKTIAERDFDPDLMIPYSEAERLIVGKYTEHFISKEVPLRADWFTDEQIERYSYLNEMAEDEEFVTIPYDSKLSGGRILVPGDQVKMYAVYHEADPVTGRMNKLAEVDVLFENITITDLLNAQEESIRNLLEDASRLPKAEREKLLANKQFQDKLLPKYLGLIMKHDEAEALQQFLGNGQIQIKLDILTRSKDDSGISDTSGNVVRGLLTAPEEQADGPLDGGAEPARPAASGAAEQNTPAQTE